MATWAETERKIRAEIKNLVKSRADRDELYDPAPLAYTRNIDIQYPGFIGWLTDLAPERILPLKRSLNKLKEEIQLYRHLKSRYERWIRTKLEAIESKRSGKAILAEIAAARKALTLTISPYEPSDGDDHNADSTPQNRADATSTGMPILDKNGKPIGGSGMGIGSDVDIHFTADMWGPFTNGNMNSPPTGPAARPDEVLFHELVHAGRQMRGLNYRLGVNAGFDNEEEYLSVVLTNTYLSEKTQTEFRANHKGHNKLKDPDKFLDRKDINLTPRDLMERFRLHQPSLYKALADIYVGEAKWNPVRQYEDERKVKAAAAAKAQGARPVGAHR